MIWHLLNVAGLVSNLVGAILIASGVIVSKRGAAKVAPGGWGMHLIPRTFTIRQHWTELGNREGRCGAQSFSVLVSLHNLYQTSSFVA